MSDASALVPVCPTCGRSDFVYAPGRAPRCRWCGQTTGLAPGELNVVPYREQLERRGVVKPHRDRSPAAERARRKRAQEAQPDAHVQHLHPQRQLADDRTRLDIRLSVDMRDQINDLVRRRRVTATEIIRQAVEAMWEEEVGEPCGGR